MKFFLTSAVLVAGLIQFGVAYTPCGNDTKNEKVEDAVDETIDRLMGMRKPNWGWESFATVISLQVSEPKRFFGRKKTSAFLRRVIRRKGNSMTMREQALHSIAARSVCLNERNVSGIDLVQKIADRLDGEFDHNGTDPKSGYNMFSIGIGALCVGEYPIKPVLVNKLLAAQNADGSFGNDFNKLVDTVLLLPPMYCLSQMYAPFFNATRVGETVREMRKFIKSKVVTTAAGEVFIGNRDLTDAALLGLWISKEGNENSDKWKCNQIMDTLGTFPDPDESEGQLYFRLMLLRGVGFINVGAHDWKCIKTDPIPEGYKPTCNHSKPETCKLKPIRK